MRSLILVLSILLFATTTWSAPYLISDCQDDFQGDYVLIFDANIQATCPAVQMDCPEGKVRVNFDMATLNLPDGQHSMEGYARNVWGESIHVPFGFSKQVPGNPSGIKLSPTP